MPARIAFRSIPVVLAIVLQFAAASWAAANDDADRLGVPGPLSFDGAEFVLAWSSNPSPGYFKQEYVPEGEAVERYTRMLLVEAAAGVDLKTALSAQVTMLNQRKAGGDPLVNMDVIMNERTGEALLDFIVSDKDAQGGYIAEWNAYRYTPLPDGKGVMLFAVSHRAYGDDEVRAFLGNLRAVRPDQIDKLARHALPEVVLPQ